MRPVKNRRRDPAPSRLRYRATRLWLRPGFRRLVNVGVPMIAGLAASWTLMAEFDLAGSVSRIWNDTRAAIVERPQFIISSMDIPGVSEDLAEQIRVAAFVRLPANSLEVDVNQVRERVESLDAVERASVRAHANGVLEIRAIERLPVVVWRSMTGLQLLDHNGVRVAEVDSRLRRPDLPLIAGAGAAAHVPQALRLLDGAQPLHDRIRGLVRVGERRWDLVLDRDQIIQLPEEDPLSALRRVMALHAAEDLLDRDVVAIDLRNPERPMLRLSEFAESELVRLRMIALGEDA
ncbi:cell division protein FtsQ/DivIB [Amaricoccus tamworthensis]|uniref:cell division protein FtsQ/DivIB n=1 Tax=Amaricoccus tamworthensis TaxID=57002 RepID=UPI003C7A9ACA